MFSTASDVTINTGNVLNLIEIKKKAGQNVTEELMESLQITIAEWQNSLKSNNNDACVVKKSSVFVSRPHDDVQTKMAEDERKNLKIGVKIFIQNDSTEALKECLEKVYSTLGTDMIDNVVLAYNPSSAEGKLQGGDGQNKDGSGPGDGQNQESTGDTNGTSGPDCDKILPGLMQLWETLEEYAKKGRILQLGVSDLDEACFRRLHGAGGVRPTIVQINLASCCVVPPGLQSFCKDNDVQLLTHSDPQEIISKESLTSVMGGTESSMRWCVRYQVHIKCRGVLALKGYITSASLDH